MKSYLVAIPVTLYLVLNGIQCNHREIYKEECVVWDNVTTIVEKEPRLNVTCKTNADCTGFDCRGDYSYKNTFLTGGDTIYRDTCFGVDLHPCSSPPNMTVYIDIAHYKSSYLRTVSSDTKDTLSDVEEDPLPGTKVNVELNTEFEVVRKDRKNYAKIHMILQPVVHGPFGYKNRPDEAKVVMVPDVEVPIPRCDPKVEEIVHTKGVCPDLSSTGGRGFKKAERFIVPGSENCTMNSWTSSCGERQVCMRVNGSTTITACHCLSCHYYSEELKRCEEDQALCESDEGLIVLDDGVSHSEPSTKQKDKTVNVVGIACGVAAVFVVLAILVVFVLFMYRRFRHRFGSGASDTTAVLGNQVTEEDDDDPIAL